MAKKVVLKFSLPENVQECFEDEETGEQVNLYKCPNCDSSIEIWQAKRNKGYVGQCYWCGMRFFGRSLGSFNSLFDDNWLKKHFKKVARDGSSYYYDAKFGLRAFKY